MHLIRHLCHIFSEMVESERHAYLIVILQQLEKEIGFSAEGGNGSAPDLKMADIQYTHCL